MRKCIIDSSRLIRHWRQQRSRHRALSTSEQVVRWARELIKLSDSDAIVTPIAVEFLAGFTNRHELRFAQAFIEQFRCIDERKIPTADWDNTLRLARWVPRNGKPRQLGDCLIRAIADRLGYTVLTSDKGFPR